MGTATLGVIIGNRDFFPDRLVTEGRKLLLERLHELDIDPVMLGESAGKSGAVETYEDAKDCASLLRTNEGRIDGVLVSLPNFGDEKGVTDALRLSRLDVPVLVQAFPDDLQRLQPSNRRDAFCGKISVCNNLRQAGIPFSLTKKHVVHPADESFTEDLRRFAAICRVVKGLRRARLGVVGARPAAFNTGRGPCPRSLTSICTVTQSCGWVAGAGSVDTPLQGRCRCLSACRHPQQVPGSRRYRAHPGDIGGRTESGRRGHPTEETPRPETTYYWSVRSQCLPGDSTTRSTSRNRPRLS